VAAEVAHVAEAAVQLEYSRRGGLWQPGKMGASNRCAVSMHMML
jgi:hypothetical protein